jgi:tetratricopeptide (TPR) repeat protein
MKQVYKIWGLIILSMAILVGCAKQNAPIVKQVYHDLTGHYNTYFNANETYHLAIKNIEQNRFEDYDTIIPLYAYGTLDDTKNSEADFKLVIEKSELVVQTHQEKDKSKNYKKGQDNSITNWADDAFLIMAKSYFMIGEYEKAESCLRYITANFPEHVDARSKDKVKKDNRNTKKKAKTKSEEKELIKKESKGIDTRPSKSLFVHEGANSEALVWLAKTYTAQGKFSEAEAIFTHIQSDRKFLKNYDRDLELAKGYYYLQKGSIENAIPRLESSLNFKSKKKESTRQKFVLAQLYEHQGNNTKAAQYYGESIKGNPNFDMVFYAKFNLVKMSRKGGFDKFEAEKLLSKLLKDNKNREFRDQMYYEKAMLALSENNRYDAKEMLKKSVESSISNNNQKAKSYVLLAELFYEEEDYVTAQGYYDSSLAFINTAHKDYDFIYNRSIILTDLVTYLNTIQTNDSILLLAALPQKEREDFLYKLAVDLVEKEDKESQQSLAGISTPESSGKGSKSSWYFYNETTRSAGHKKFKQIWGDRELEDNWRRSDKRSGDVASDDDGPISKDIFFARIDAKYAELLSNIPTSEEEKTLLKDQNIEAYFQAGLIYKNDLDNPLKSIQTFEELIKKYPLNVNELESYYNLYLLHEGKVKAKADRYKALIIEKYPDSKFAQILRDPDYYAKQQNKDRAVTEFYEATFRMFTSEQYDAVIERVDLTYDIFSDNPLQAKFDLLKALAIGGKKEYDPYVESLNYVIANHQNTEEQAKASELLGYLKGEYPKDKPLTPSKLNKDKLDAINKVGKDIDALDTKDALQEDEEKKGGLKFKFGEKEFKLGGQDSEEK